MNQIYGVEPDLCIQNPRLLLDFGKDIVLPQYFYTQLQYLKEGNYHTATKAADEITRSLEPIENLENILVFKTPENGLLYFINQEVSLANCQFTEDQLDLRYPLNRYLLLLFRVSSFFEVSVTFLINSSPLIQKCSLLNFNIINTDDLCSYSEPSLDIELILSIQPYLKTINSTTPQIQWSDELEAVSKTRDIYWQDF